MYGLEVYNPTSDLILTQDYRMYQVVATGSFTNSSGMPEGIGWSGDTRLLMVTPRNLGETLFITDPPAGYIGIGATGGTIDYMILAQQPVFSGDNYGMNLWLPGGTLAFESGRRTIRPVLTYKRPCVGFGGSWGEENVPMPFAPKPGRRRYVDADCLYSTNTRSGGGIVSYYGTYVKFNLDGTIICGDGGPFFTRSSPLSFNRDWGGVARFNFMDI